MSGSKKKAMNAEMKNVEKGVGNYNRMIGGKAIESVVGLLVFFSIGGVVRAIKDGFEGHNSEDATKGGRLVAGMRAIGIRYARLTDAFRNKDKKRGRRKHQAQHSFIFSLWSEWMTIEHDIMLNSDARPSVVAYIAKKFKGKQSKCWALLEGLPIMKMEIAAGRRLSSGEWVGTSRAEWQAMAAEKIARLGPHLPSLTDNADLVAFFEELKENAFDADTMQYESSWVAQAEDAQEDEDF